MLYYMLTGRHAFGDGIRNFEMQQHRDQLLSTPHWKNLYGKVHHRSDSVQDLLWGMLKVHSNERFTLDDVKRHPWIEQDRAQNPRAAYVGEASYDEQCGRQLERQQTEADVMELAATAVRSVS